MRISFFLIRRFDEMSTSCSIRTSSVCSAIGDESFFEFDSLRGIRGGRPTLARCGTIADGGTAGRSADVIVKTGATDGVATR